MVLPPVIEELVAKTDQFEALEQSDSRFPVTFDLLSELSQSRVRDVV